MTQNNQSHCAECHQPGDDVPDLHFCILHPERSKYPGGCCCHNTEETEYTWALLNRTGE